MELDMESVSRMSEKLAALLDYPQALKEIGAHSRKTALKDFDANVVMPHFFPKIREAYTGWNG